MSGDTAPAVGVWVFPEAPAPELVDLARHVEDLGLDELWVGDEGPARDPFAVLAAAAVATDRIRLATGITNPYVRHPGVTAASMLTIHELSGGRAVLGVGAGGQLSLSPFGLEASRPVHRMSEFLDIAGAVATVVSWARSVRSIDIALYPSVAFTEKAVERHRPEMIWGLLDTPPEVRDELGLDLAAVKAAAQAIREGDPEPARRLVDDTVLERVMLVGDPSVVGNRLAGLVREHRPTSIGLALLQDDLHEGVGHAAEAFAAMTTELGGG